MALHREGNRLNCSSRRRIVLVYRIDRRHRKEKERRPMCKVLQFKGLSDPGQQQQWRRAAINGRDLAQIESTGFGRELDAGSRGKMEKGR